MDEIHRTLGLGDKIIVQTMHGREDTVIGHLPDGCVVLFDKKSEYFNLLAPGQSVEGHVIHIRENYVIVNPISEPQEIEIVYLPEESPVYLDVEVDAIVEDLEKLIKTVPKNAKVIPKALLRIIRLEQVIIKILRGKP